MVIAVEARGLTKVYGETPALSGLDVSVATGECYGLLGLNSAGKTTTVRLLTTLIEPTDGQARVLGLDVVEHAADVRTHIGVAGEANPSPEPAWSGVRYLRYFARIHGLDRDVAEARIRDVVDALHLRDHAERPLRSLSGGNRRKVELARAVLHRPAVLFLDEPTRELDIPAKRATWAFLRELQRGGTTIFLSSHDVSEIANVCGRIGVLQAGRLFWEGTPQKAAGPTGSLLEGLCHLLEGIAPDENAPAAPRTTFQVVSGSGAGSTGDPR